MLNKIQPGASASYSSQVNRTNGNRELARDKGVEFSNSSAELSLSDNAMALQRTWQAVKNSPDVRVEAVEAVRSQLEAKTYQVNVGALVEHLLPLLK